MTTAKLVDVIEGLNGFEFGSFDEFVKIKDTDLSDLDHINLKDLYRRVSVIVTSIGGDNLCQKFV